MLKYASKYTFSSSNPSGDDANDRNNSQKSSSNGKISQQPPAAENQDKFFRAMEEMKAVDKLI